MLQNLIAGAVLGFAIGIITGFFGAGGGFIMTPALNVFFGMDMAIAVGTSSFQVSCASLLTLLQRLDRKMYGAKVALYVSAGILPGTWIGASIVSLLQRYGSVSISDGRSVPVADIALLVLFCLLLVSIIFCMSSELRGKKKEKDEVRKGILYGIRMPPCIHFRTIPYGTFSAPVLAFLGLVMGILSGVLGIGGGVIMFPVMYYLVGQQTRYATLTTTMIVFISGVGSTIFHWMNGNICMPLVPYLVAGSFAGTSVGIRLQNHVNAVGIRKYFVVVVAFAFLLVLWKLYRLVF